jgi:HK97 family phage portal protein
MLFYGGAFVVVLSVNASGRVNEFRWVDPLRVGVQTDITGTIVEYYTLDGNRVPMNGVGSIKYIPYTDEGLLNRNAGVVLTAVELQEAAKRASQEPTPTVVLKNSGVELPANRVQAILDAWKQARRTRSTAFLNSALDIETVGFNPKDQQLVEARIFTTGTEIARAVGIPAWYLNADSNSMTYSNTEQERRNLIDFSLRPYLTSLQNRFNMPDFSEPNSEFRFDVSDFLRSSAIEEKDILTAYVEAGILSLEEARARLDLTARGIN